MHSFGCFWLSRPMLTRIFDGLKDALFPSKCLLCGTFFQPPEKDAKVAPANGARLKELLSQDGQTVFSELMAPFLCPDCSSDFIPLESPLCPMCGYMFESREGADHLCGECLQSPKKVRMARAAGVYDRALLGIIHALKYRGKIQLARPLGLLLLAVFMRCYGQSLADHSRVDTENPWGVDIILPVPLHMRRFRKRGFNQSYLLIREWKNVIEGMENRSPSWLIDRNTLLKSRYTESQTGFGRMERQVNVKNAFGLQDASSIEEKRVLLVDDVYTTGSTVEECARILLQGGAKYVDVLTLARAM